MHNPVPGWRIQVDTAEEMGLTVADWRATAKRNPARYEWAIPFLKDRFDGEFVAPILRDALNCDSVTR